MIWRQRDPNTGFNRNLLTFARGRSAKRLQDLLRQRGELTLIARFRLHDCELIATQTRDQILWADAAAQSDSDLPEQLVADLMPE